MNAVINVNNLQKQIAFSKLEEYYGNQLGNKTIGIWGLSFKPDTDDIREAPSLYLIKSLLDRGCKIKAYDPEAMDNIRAIFGDKIEYVDTHLESCRDVDALVIMTEWSIFRDPDFEYLKANIKDRLIFDGRNLYSPVLMKEMGFNYLSIGRP